MLMLMMEVALQVLAPKSHSPAIEPFTKYSRKTSDGFDLIEEFWYAVIRTNVQYLYNHNDTVIDQN